MAIKITTDCINCGACEPECPNTAIYEPGAEWTYAQGTSVTELELENGESMSAHKLQEAVSKDYYYIVSNKCTECIGFHEEPQCASVCPVDCCVPDPEVEESQEDLLAKKAWLHAE